MGALIIGGAGIALVNDIPAMLLSVSRLTFAWSSDGIFPRIFSKVGITSKTPTNALLLSGTMASVGIIGSHFAGDFFLGIDIMVTAMMINFTLMCITLLLIDRRQPLIANNIKIFNTNKSRKAVGAIGLILMTVFLGIHLYKDLVVSSQIWYLKSTPTYLVVMSIGAAIYFYKTNQKVE
jgi:APA family basic amino acid/polyamine antiporter